MGITYNCDFFERRPEFVDKFVGSNLAFSSPPRAATALKKTFPSHLAHYANLCTPHPAWAAGL